MKPTSQAAVLFVRGDGKMNELTISLDPHRKTPLYEQIYGFIREEIRGGRIRAGERLPSARALWWTVPSGAVTWTWAKAMGSPSA
jgi:GntR family transcriptional regulator/MocR family aminotransferase